MSNNKNDSLGDRMKRFEAAFKTVLPPRMPIILRVDGKTFHTYTRLCEKPFDLELNKAMDKVAIKLCEEIQGAQLAYIQSDEISILIHNYKRFNSGAWFENEIQKMVSVSAGIASATFTKESYHIWRDNKKFNAEHADADGIVLIRDYYQPACFDSRVFVLPEEEVVNCLYWRQQDAVRNSIQMLARSLYSHKECFKKNQAELQEMCFQKGHNWNDLPTSLKRGRCVVKNPKWVVDNEIPIFKDDRNYIERWLKREEE